MSSRTDHVHVHSGGGGGGKYIKNNTKTTFDLTQSKTKSFGETYIRRSILG